MAGALVAGLAPGACPLGPADAWPAALRGALGMVLASPVPMLLLWGKKRVAFHNDALARLIGSGHALATGRPAREGWPLLWKALGPLSARVLGGEEAAAERISLLLDHHGAPAEAVLDIAASAVREEGEAGGVLCVVLDATERVLAERRLGALRAMALPLAGAESAAGACVAALAVLAAENPGDLPWARVLLREEGGPRVVASHGAEGDGVPEAVLEAVLRGGAAREVPGALVLPLADGGRVAGVLVAGLNPNRPLAGDYGTYLGLAAGQVSLAVARLLRAREERRAAARLRESESMFRTMAEHAPVMVWVMEADGRCTYLSRRWYDFTGQAPGEGLGFGWLDAVHPEDRPGVTGVVARAMETGSAFRTEYRLRAADGRYVWMIDAAAPRQDGAGRFAGFVGSILDISERRRDEEARDLLARELSHRIKNIFMVTGGLAALTARGDPAAEAFAASLQARLRALALAHDLARPDAVLGPVPLVHSEGAPAGGRLAVAGGAPALPPVVARPLTVHGLLSALLAPYGDGGKGRVTIEGEDRSIGYAVANALALALHEQATNAVKYGALSRPEGRLRVVTVTEGMGAEAVFRLDWTETGGPPVAGPPTRTGFGTTLAARSLASQVRGRMVHDWRPEGLALRVELPEASLAGR
ncbi:PAS domain S-box protein [Roseomonas nepalensis]|uniref:histidine kinase n=1 Tax=Muricoccus nepalensis TaxID=1854500 RepID=A0A502FQK2_9PROT|nr:PAS domain S-box protein [Roseomonas nepalensis]TPG51828.1 PAS domain S-box protein [Roseomonas nepalensis]